MSARAYSVCSDLYLSEAEMCALVLGQFLVFFFPLGRVLECGMFGAFSHGPQLGSRGLIDLWVANSEAGFGASLFVCAGIAFG